MVAGVFVSSSQYPTPLGPLESPGLSEKAYSCAFILLLLICASAAAPDEVRCLRVPEVGGFMNSL